ncbi:LRR receptor-like serine/threonine-protein kinase IOS1 [Glycine max]|nr:LRR receptor-like serine/threonine-protein kinase IOS1 [Glycine max]
MRSRGLVLAVLIQAQDQSGFISIDCGAPAGVSYTELTRTGINYISDANFIDTGVSRKIVSELKSVYQQQLWDVRSFPEGKRNCYKISITRGSTYLIRTSFLYGNYDGLNTEPQFDIHLGANRWATVIIYNATIYYAKEIIHVPSQDYVQICLVNTGHGIPFISAIELRTLKNDTYVTQFGSLETYNDYERCDLGSNTGGYRYKDDVYDRFWNTCDFDEDWTPVLNASIPADSLEQNDYEPPAIVLSTAVTPANVSVPLVIKWVPQDPTDQFYVYMHFLEIQVLATNQTRQFSITENGKTWFPNLSPTNQSVDTIYSLRAVSGEQIKYSFEMTENSTLPPIISAIEIYRVIDFQQSDTFQGDVDAITAIKSVYGVTRDWQGDPCAPIDYLWDGLNCTYPGNDSPRITTLDLSNNSLKDEVPDFLSQLQHLKILNLEKNNLSGSIPSTLVEKSKEGSLALSVGQNPYLCESGQCNQKEKEKEKGKDEKSIVTPVVASVGGAVILLVVLVAILWTLKRRKSKEKDQSQISLQYTDQDDSFLQSKKQIYSYSDVLKITNNFNAILGKGGFGTVYLGYIDDTPVAVKMLSPSSVHGYQQFQAEVKLLMRVHHKCLTSLVGYCNEGNDKCLIYEYMANGNLQEHLTGKRSKTKFFTWEERLRIAVDAALGLEYLQNGCKPPIIHRDVKSTNILLNEHFQAKLSDFGLSKIIPTDGVTHVSTVVAGTPGYLDPEYFITNRLTEKSDVYSFGVVLLEIITSQPVIARKEESIHISEWVSSLIAKGDIEAIVDPRLEGDFDSNSVWKAVEIATACLSPNMNKRPITSVIVIELKESLAMELARTKYSGVETRDSVKTVTMNLNTEFSPQASIDCGLEDEPNYTDETTSIYYSSDVNFTNSGVSHSISSKYKASLDRQFWNVRSFPDGTRNCYTLVVPQVSSKKYLVRARFAYGNYDGKDSLPEFDIYLGDSWWGSVVFQDASSVVTKEIIYAASSNYAHVCLFNTAKGTPFISVLELRVLNSEAYLVNFVELLARFDVGLQDGEIIRYPDDVYDRIWTPYNSNEWTQIDNTLTIDHDATTSFDFLPLPPSIVMGTAAIPANVNDNIEFHFLPKNNASTCYVYMFFAELQKLQANQIREFNIFVNGDILNNAPINPIYLQNAYHLAIIENPLELWINKTSGSTLPPLLNAIEIYMTKNFSLSETYQTDVDGIINVKSIYGIKRNWQGDPCTPLAYLWDGLNCSYAESDSPRIIYLNLEGNQLSGTIPMQLIVNSENGLLEFIFGGNPSLCSPGSSCNNKNGNKVVVPLVASLGGAFMILVITVISFCIYKRRQPVSHHLSKQNAYYKIREELESNKQEFTYAEVLSMTRNFERVVGKGGFATVYHGWIDDTEVAVKMLSPSAQGYLQFQAEAKLLAVVHHKFLTALIGYCDDGENMALIYEYMANGDLAKHLSGKSKNILSWNQRIQIAVDAAEGLEYLHHGCNMPIVHRDVKSKNILLNEKFRGKLADFGLSKIYSDEDDTHMTTVVAGTLGYLDPEYNRSHKLREKSDVFSFGIVLFEIITGQPAITKTEERTHIIQWVDSILLERGINDIVDSRLQGEFDIHHVKKALDTAKACVATTSINRPTMTHVVNELKQCFSKMMTTPSNSDDHESSPNSFITVSFDGISGQSSLQR